MVSLRNSTKYSRKTLYQFHSSSPRKWKRKEHIQTHFQSSITLRLNPDRHQEKYKYLHEYRFKNPQENTSISYICMYTQTQLSRWHSGKESTCQCRRRQRCRFNLWVGQIPWRRTRQPTSVFMPGKFHGQKNLAGCSPWSQRVGHD